MTTNNRMSKMSKMVSEKKNLIIVILIVSVLVAAYVILNYYGKNVEGFETDDDMDFILDGQNFSIDKHLVSSSEVPIGTIVAWGSSEIPKGWAKCDGKVYNGIQTPDLSGKFIFGSIGDSTPPMTNADRNQYKVEIGNMNLTETQLQEIHDKRFEYTLNAKGGKTEHALTEDEMPRHGHEIYRSNSGQNDWAAYSKFRSITTGDNPHGSGYHTNFAAENYPNYISSTGGQSVKDADGNPLKDASGNFVFETKPHTNMPPYHTLYWIMFVGY